MISVFQEPFPPEHFCEAAFSAVEAISKSGGQVMPHFPKNKISPIGAMGLL